MCERIYVKTNLDGLLRESAFAQRQGVEGLILSGLAFAPFKFAAPRVRNPRAARAPRQLIERPRSE